MTGSWFLDHLWLVPLLPFLGFLLVATWLINAMWGFLSSLLPSSLEAVDQLFAVLTPLARAAAASERITEAWRILLCLRPMSMLSWSESRWTSCDRAAGAMTASRSAVRGIERKCFIHQIL